MLCVINYPVQTHYPENTQITFPWIEFYSRAGKLIIHPYPEIQNDSDGS